MRKRRFWSKETICKLKNYPNSLYVDLKVDFLFHSNKMEGSTFSLEQFDLLVDKDRVEGSHTFDDVIETRNSVEAFDWVIETLGESLTKNTILDLHLLLKRNSSDYVRGFVGKWKTVSNRISGSDVKLADPWEVDEKIRDLLLWWDDSQKTIEDIVTFHVRFEQIHPFLDGNGRVGRLLMIKQCLEGGIVPIVIDFEHSNEYKTSLGNAQISGDTSSLLALVEKCQERLDNKPIVVSTKKSLGFY